MRASAKLMRMYELVKVCVCVENYTELRGTHFFVCFDGFGFSTMCLLEKNLHLG